MPKKLISFLIFVSIIAIIYLFFSIKPYYLFITRKLQISIIKTLFSQDSIQKNDNQINILLLGIAGGNHDGSDLTDTIIFANYNFKTNRLTTISLPRDIWSTALKDKINSAYAYGEAKQTGGGFKLAKAEIQAVVNQPIHYAILIDFDEFKNLIDALGGIDIDVTQAFVDREFPIPGRENDLCKGDTEYKCRYETISFNKGLQHMNGEVALKFARSRHATGEEGTDFARSIRQQKIILSIKEKLVQELRKKDLNRLGMIYSVIDKSLKRDITNQQLAIIAKNIYFKKNYKQISSAITEDLFYVPNYAEYNGHWVLVPKGNNFTTIYNFVSCIIKNAQNKCLQTKSSK